MSKARKSLLIVSVAALVAGAAFLSLRPAPTKAQKRAGLSQRTSSHDDGIENYDIRRDKAAGEKLATFRGRANRPSELLSELRDRQRTGVDTLRQRVPSLKVDYSPEMNTPEVIGPDVRDGKQFLTRATGAKRHEALRSFLSENSNTVGVDQSEIAKLKTVADYTDADGKLSFVELEQEINGIPVFQGGVKGGFAKSGELVRVVNNLAPGVAETAASTDFGDPVAAASAAASYINSDPSALGLAVDQGASTDQKQVLGHGQFATTAEKMYFPTEAGVVVPAWRVMIWQNGRAFYVVVDAVSGAMLWRKNLTEDQTQSASYMVYANPNSMINAPDSPFPLTPGPADPSLGTQGSAVSRSLVTLIGNEPPNTFNQLGWITDGGNTTAGNNVQAGLDRKLPNSSGPASDIDLDGMATGSPNRVFNFAFNPGDPGTGTGDNALPSGQSAGTCLAQADASLPTAYQQAAVTQLFYIVNRYHDVMYQLGFNEAAHNFQNTNFTGQGSGGDRVSAQAQDCSGTNNANFTTPADGAQPTMQMYLWPSSTRVTLDGSLDADVVLHEHTHGLSNRLHGNSTGLITAMSRGMGEGWSDFYARSLLAKPTDPVQGIYTVGGYVTSNLFASSGVSSNYYYGIRRYPLDVISHTGGANAKPHNAFTFSYLNSDCNSRMNNTNFAFARSTAFGGSTCDEVHNIGEIWASILWEARGRFITRLGATAGNQRMLQLVTDGMKLAPINPTFLTERDAIIAAAQAGGSAADVADLWAGFAARGLGASASIQVIGGTNNQTKVTDGFDLPNLTQTQNITVGDLTGDGDGYPEPGENVTISVPITNGTGQTATGVTVAIVGGATNGYGTISNNQTITQPVNFTIPAGTTCGTYLPITVNVNSSLGAVSFPRQIFVGKPATTNGSQNFDSVTAPSLPTGWTATSIQSGVNFVTTTTAPDAGTNAAFAADPSTVGGETDLSSPMVSVVSSSATLTFRQNYNVEADSDGGVLEISIAGNPFQDITAVGGSFTQNGYSGNLGNSGLNNPLIGRAAWTGSSGGYVTTIAQLPAVANGKLVQLKWRFGADNNTAPASGGWWIDTVSLSGAAFVTSYSCLVTPPTSAAVTISGRALNPGGFGLKGVRVSLRDASGNVLSAMTNAFGYYTFQNVASGQTVTLNAYQRGHVFSARSVQVTDNLASVDLTATQ
ncbi:MAG: M36 family metallopeptidase [Pyrinomonadaceae bacterium]